MVFNSTNETKTKTEVVFINLWFYLGISPTEDMDMDTTMVIMDMVTTDITAMDTTTDMDTTMDMDTTTMATTDITTTDTPVDTSDSETPTKHQLNRINKCRHCPN